MSDERRPRHPIRSLGRVVPWGAASRIAVALLLGAGLLLGAAHLLRSDGPRTLPFPTFDPQAPFPELVPRPAESESSREETAPKELSRFEQALQRASRPSTPAPEETGSEDAAEPPAGRAVPLGETLVGEIPTDQAAWRWSDEDGVTLVVHTPGGGRPDALIFAEGFREEIATRPTSELHRFHVAVDPLGRGGSPLLGTFLDQLSRKAAAEGDQDRRTRLLARARAAQVLATRTLGRGLGFAPAEDGITGTRWVGRTEAGVVLRLARSDGTWAGQGALPADVAAAAAELVPGQVPGSGATTGAGSLGPVPAYLLAGSVATRNERFGVHLAILCSTSPRCPVADELAAFLDSIDSVGPDRVRRLRDGFHAPFGELVRATGLELSGPLEPSHSSPSDPSTAPSGGAP